MSELEDFMREWVSESPFIRVRTSGSTGSPKELLVEKERMLASARVTCDFLNLRKGSKALLCLPLDYIAGKMMVVRSIERDLQLQALPMVGHPLRGDNMPDNASLIAMVPLQVYNTLQVPVERERLKMIDNVIIGGGAVSAALEKELADFPNAVWSTYGMTETLSHIALRRLSGADRSDWYVPFDGVTLSQNTDGCLVIDAPHVVADGVPLVTNDIVEMEADGRRFRVKGRRDNTICSGGVKIQAEEVERLLQPHLHAPFAITSQPDEKFGEVVVLVTEESDVERIETVCKEVLPKFSRPRRIVCVDELPMTETGKPARGKIREKIEG